MRAKTYDGAALEEALRSDLFANAGVELVGMLKPTDKSGHIQFTKSGCDAWVELPTSMIDNAEHLGQARCKDHSHPIFKILLKEATSPEAKVLATLLAQPATTPDFSDHMLSGAGESTQPPTSAILAQRALRRPTAQIPAGLMRGPLPGAHSGTDWRRPLGEQFGVTVRPNAAYWPTSDGWQCVGWGDCINMINEVGYCTHFDCYTGWLTGEVTCICKQ
ncbi:hypothetical protein [Mycolicibacterium baixiangningiae]|uniref:hypothetical protein n=1 Tax=Mycolicibacterium baixiangningiae TaxID=2761578 RepID=UPI001867837E|nr:hypothetical protein [Mycolicibacterium baixiangningiae]